MGKIANGILGAFSGKVGPVVGSSRKGVPYLKSIPKRRTKKISPREKANREKFKVAQKWLRPLVDFVREGYKGYAPRAEGFIAAKSYLMKNAMEAVGSKFKINPALMKVSFGTLALSKNIAFTLDQNKLLFTWDTSQVDQGYGKDQVMLLAYNIKSGNVMYKTTGEFRSSGSDTLAIPPPKGGSCHIWLAFVSADRTRQSDSIYLGEIKS